MPRLLVFYHFFHPDQVAGARQFADLAEEQVRRGWQVTAVTSNRVWHDPRARLPAREDWRGVDVRRIFRPAWPQARALPRLGNSAFLLGAWTAALPSLPPADAVIIGSDPAFAPLLALPLRAAGGRHTVIAHWCFDLYPEAIEAEGTRGVRPLVPAARALMARAYRACDALVDLGPTMRRRLGGYGGTDVHRETIPPWALAEPPAPEPPDPTARAALFPGARLALLYAGTLGRAHEFGLLLDLARACAARSGRAIQFCFGCRGARLDDLKAGIGPGDINVSLAPFADEADLPARLGAADLHLASLRADWAGLVVPSKLFASLAAGRPVIYAGPGDSDIAAFIRETGAGIHVDGAGDLGAAVDRLHALADDRAALARWQAAAHAAYAARFAKRLANDRWDALLRRLMSDRAARPRLGAKVP